MGENRNVKQMNARDLAEIAKSLGEGAELSELKRRARAIGVTGQPGGWIYLPDATKPICQGWSNFAVFIAEGLARKARELAEAMAPTVEQAERLDFTPAAGVTPTQHAEGVTVYEATAAGVTYRVLGTLVDPMTSRRRVFRAYRVTGKTGHTLHPAGPGGPLSTRAAAYAEAEADLGEVLRDRAAAARPERTEFAGSHAFRPGTADPRRCDFGDCGASVDSRNHDGWLPREVTYPTSICPDAEAGKPHAAHRIDGTWREQCQGIEPAETVVAMPTPAPAREQQMAGRKLRGPAHAHLDAPCTDACYEPEAPSPDFEAGQLRDDRITFVITERGQAKIAALVAQRTTPKADPATEDSVPELVDRVVRRAQYEALKAMLGVLAGWIEGARSNCMADGHRGEDVPCGQSFHVEDIRNMINDAARELRTAEPWKATDR